MDDASWLRRSERWFALLLHCYPRDFREHMGAAIVDAYVAQARDAGRDHVPLGIVWVWMRAAGDSLVNGIAEHVRPATQHRRRGDWGRDLALARRRLRRSPVFVAAALATLTIGLAAFAVVYTAVDKVLLQPLPYRDSGDLYVVWRDRSATAGLAREWLAGPDIAALQSAHGVIEAAAGTQLATPTLSLRRDGEPLPELMMLMSPNLFDLLGVKPMLGRSFSPNEVGPARPSVVILSHAMWTRLGASPALVGSQVWLSGVAYTVIGVMPADFRFVRHATLGPPQEPDVFMPFRFHVADQDANAASFGTVIRARHGTPPDQVATAVAAVARGISNRAAARGPVSLYPVRMQDDLVAPVRPILITLGLTALVLMLVLTVNLSSLLLARAAEREREFAVSRALGADGAAIVRLGGGIGGALAGSWGARTLVALAPLDLPRRADIVLDWGVALVVIATGLAVGLVAALLPAAWANRVSLGSLLASAAVRGAATPQRLRRSVVVAQVALTLVLLTAGALVVRSFERVIAADPGFRPDGVLTFSVAMGPRLFPNTADGFRFQERVESGLRGLPGVTGASATAALPLGAAAGQATITFPGAPGNTGDSQRDAALVDVIATRGDYPQVIGMRVIAGRAFEAAPPSGVREALIDRHLAARFFPTGSPIGAAIPFNGQSLTIVGVVDQARLYNLHEDGRPQLLVRAEDWAPYMPFFVVRTSGDPQALEAEVRGVIRRVDPRIPVSMMRTMDEITTDALRQQRITAVLLGGFAMGALLLVAMGVFALVSGSVVRRHGEFAIRLALGATHRQVLRMIVADAALLVAIGMGIAAPGVYGVGGLLRGLLVGVSPSDPATLTAVAAGLLLVTVAACGVAARRVLVIDPAPLLRHD